MFERVASEMACVHNMIIRGLNSIVLQAPHVQAADVPSFVGYAIQWYRLLHVHHTSEETDFFVSVERMTGQKGVMDDNVEQHAAFSEGIEAFKRYLDVCAKRPGEFDGHKIVRMLDEIGHPLVLHLTDEVPTLLYLRRFGDKMDSLEKVFGEEGERNMVSTTSRRRMSLTRSETVGAPQGAAVVLREPRHHVRGGAVGEVAAGAQDRGVPLQERLLLAASGHVEVWVVRSGWPAEAAAGARGEVVGGVSDRCRCLTKRRLVVVMCLMRYLFGSRCVDSWPCVPVYVLWCARPGGSGRAGAMLTPLRMLRWLKPDWQCGGSCRINPELSLPVSSQEPT